MKNLRREEKKVNVVYGPSYLSGQALDIHVFYVFKAVLIPPVGDLWTEKIALPRAHQTNACQR